MPAAFRSVQARRNVTPALDSNPRSPSGSTHASRELQNSLSLRATRSGGGGKEKNGSADAGSLPEIRCAETPPLLAFAACADGGEDVCSLAAKPRFSADHLQK